jgi:MFS transporter, AAHS family, 4-hydroxybenzoate transporter
VATYLNSLSTSVAVLAGTRFVTGLFMSAVLSNAVSLLSEYAPQRYRATLITLSFVGFSLGTVCGSLISTRITASSSWQHALVIGAILPLCAAVFLFFTLPESVTYLVMRDPKDARIARLLAKLDPALSFAPNTHFVVSERERVASGVSVAALFQHGRAPSTVLLAVAFTLTLFNAAVSATWMPTVLVDKAKLTLEQSGDFGALMGTASIVSMLFLGRLIDAAGAARVLAIAYLVGGFATIGIALVPWDSPARLALTALIGMTTMAGQSGLNALATVLYPVQIRATGTGWTRV